MSFFSKRTRLIEVPVVASDYELTPEGWQGMRALAANPFMQIILKRLALQNAALTARLKERFDRIEDVSFVQQGVFWTGWLQRELNRLSAAPAKPSTEASNEIEEVFSEIDAQLERVGIEAPQEPS